MNEKRRDQLRGAIRKISEVQSTVDIVFDAETDCIDNMPENLQGTDRFERMEDAAERLSDALELLEDARSLIQSAVDL